MSKKEDIATLKRLGKTVVKTAKCVINYLPTFKCCEFCKRKYIAKHPGSVYCYNCKNGIGRAHIQYFKKNGHFPQPRKDIQCKTCGKIFKQRLPQQKYCNDECRVLWNEDHGIRLNRNRFLHPQIVTSLATYRRMPKEQQTEIDIAVDDYLFRLDRRVSLFSEVSR